MKYIIDIPSEQIEKIKNLVDEGRYKNIPEFTQVSIDNQIYLEYSNLEIFDITQESYHKKTENLEIKINDYLKLNDLQQFKKKSTSHLISPANMSESCLWGQYNRIFPIKLTLRILANIINSNGSNVNLDYFKEEASNAARELGLQLKYMDEIYKRNRDVRLSTGLPIGEDKNKALSRFKMHFVGYLTKNNNVEGAPGSLGFVNIFKGENGKVEIGITEAGLDFSILKNPILDGEYPKTSLFDEERKYYINHIFQNVKGEAKAMKLILESIKNGFDTPNSLNEIVRRLNDNWSDDMTNTMKVGLISRLFDLQLITKKKDGLKVRYFLTPMGESVASENR